MSGLYEVYEEIKYFIVVSVRNMNWSMFFMKLCIASLIIAALMGGCNYFIKTFDLTDDHISEESIEEMIREEEEFQIDLTPRTSESTRMHPID